MSEVTRYTFDMAACWYEHPDGEFVEHDAYAKLEAAAQALREEVAALRARVVVVPDAANDRRKSAHYCRGWNACLDELARLSGKTVSEGLLRRIAAPVNNQDELDAVHEARIELRALLNQDKENGNG